MSELENEQRVEEAIARIEAAAAAALAELEEALRRESGQDPQ